MRIYYSYIEHHIPSPAIPKNVFDERRVKPHKKVGCNSISNISRCLEDLPYWAFLLAVIYATDLCSPNVALNASQFGKGTHSDYYILAPERIQRHRFKNTFVLLEIFFSILIGDGQKQKIVLVTTNGAAISSGGLKEIISEPSNHAAVQTSHFDVAHTNPTPLSKPFFKLLLLGAQSSTQASPLLTYKANQSDFKYELPV